MAATIFAPSLDPDDPFAPGDARSKAFAAASVQIVPAEHGNAAAPAKRFAGRRFADATLDGIAHCLAPRPKLT